MKQFDNVYRIYGETVEPGVREDGGRIVRTNGCNGRDHVAMRDNILGSNEDGEDLVPLGFVELGPCDTTCSLPESQAKAWFTYVTGRLLSEFTPAV